MSRPSFGVPATSITDIDIISPEVRQQIVAGKDVNLNTLLIPNYETLVKKKTQEKDERLQRVLSSDEFIMAFGNYKRIMCSAFSSRAEELDLYLAHVIETANIWPHKFYEYHKMFSAKCATMLIQYNVKIDWSKGDIELRQKICAGSRVNSCAKCYSTMHSTNMCPSKSQFHTGPGKADTLGREIVYHNGQQVYNNFNWVQGCSKPYCKYVHVCKQCKSKNHGRNQCPTKNKESSNTKPKQQNQKPVTDKEIPTTGAACRGIINAMSTTIRDSLDCSIDNLWTHALSRATLTAYESGIGFVEADCHNNWKSFNRNCYLFLNHNPMNWQSSRDYCAHAGAKLVEIDSSDEDTFILQNAKDLHLSGHCFWLGGSDARLPGVWMWSTSRKMLMYTNWAPGEPNHYHSHQEHCLNLHYYTRSNVYLWNDESCAEPCYPICEQPNPWIRYTDKPSVPTTTTTSSTTTTTAAPTTTTTTPLPTTTTTTPLPPTTKHLQMVTLPQNPQTTDHTSCQSGWIRFGSSCYLFATDISYDWVESGHFCTLFGASLASIETDIENNFIRQQLLSIAKSVDFWVGGTDILTEGDWKWMTSQKPITYFDWYPGRPNDFHHNVNCLELHHNYKYQWNDQDCRVLNHFICEMP
ncbi:macrophage mannose receptor 1-like [Saccostrea echinata]|uniref:macrophage mannose receptor 1-like n=1 Tax=Saccostrea echinata TaxID=191078 RepID=UPI002A83365F|nr:macrophage mannose receptor 1-like [Saccostrea echinata]